MSIPTQAAPVARLSSSRTASAGIAPSQSIKCTICLAACNALSGLKKTLCIAACNATVC